MGEFWSEGRLPFSFKEGLLVLLPKVDDPELLGHWCPVTMLNTPYKVIAKVIASRLALVLPSIIPIQQQGFIKGRSTQNCILTFALVHEALKRGRRSGIFFMLDQEKAYDRVAPEYLHGVTVPFIQRLKIDNDRGLIRPVTLAEGLKISTVCLVDDTAIYMEVDEGSARNLFSLLALVQVASGGRINLQKSKILMIGKRCDAPHWLRGLGLQMVGRIEQVKYLGASLTTTWRGVDNGQTMIAAISRKAQKFTSPLLSFEARAVAVKYAVFACLIYHLLFAKYKRGTLKLADSILRKYIWSQNQDGQQKRPLVSRELMATPEQWGGLGIYELHLFQRALLIRTLFKAISNPDQSIWAPILQKVFLQSQTVDFGVALATYVLPIRFLAARLHRYCWRSAMGSARAAQLASLVKSWCLTAGCSTLHQLKQLSGNLLTAGSGDNSSEIASILNRLQEVDVRPGQETFFPQDWRDSNSKELNIRGMFDGRREYVMRNGVGYAGLGKAKLVLAVVWRMLWAERCVLKHQGKTNRVSGLKAVYLFMEEQAARRMKVTDDARKFCARQLLSVLPVIPPRFLQLLQ
ncbi:hypothetical protein R1sor_016749 [Riccia sorocarpa]|uniref:Reverse transcriptase domain-containing protein n=1 Tax=Riccia sorocarpa TaxID=122646 RepID=A0ABD3HK15_9MARC